MSSASAEVRRIEWTGYRHSLSDGSPPVIVNDLVCGSRSPIKWRRAQFRGASSHGFLRSDFLAAAMSGTNSGDRDAARKRALAVRLQSAILLTDH